MSKQFALCTLAVVLGSLSASTNARAIPLPDSGFCNLTGGVCLTIAQDNSFGYAIVGRAHTGGAVEGLADSSGVGVYGESNSGRGVFGYSLNGNGMLAVSGSSDALVAYAGNCSGCAGVWGQANSNNTGSFALYGTGNLKLVAGQGQSGNAYKPTGINWINTSDARVKKDIVDFTPSLAQLKKVRPVRFKFNGLADTVNDGKEHVGVLAQELEKIFPSMVTSLRGKLHPTDTEDMDIKQVDANDFTFLLINSVKELSAQNDALRDRIKALEDRRPSYAAGLSGNGILGLGLAVLAGVVVLSRRRV
jgi:hypothetical protein